MGWWPFSSSDNSDNHASGRSENDVQPTQPPQKRDFSLTDEQRIRIFGRPGPAKGSSSDSKEDEEINAFLREIGAEPTAPAREASPAPYPAVGGIVPPTPQTSTQTQPPAPLTHSEDGRRTNPDGTLDISPDAMYPRTMSCRQAFDQAFYCQSLGGKFNDIYRHGSLQPCSEQWGAFWFCMRIRTYADKDKEELISDHYKGRDERKRKLVGSSEDVWDIRTRAVEKAFGKDPDAEDGGGLLVRE